MNPTKILQALPADPAELDRDLTPEESKGLEEIKAMPWDEDPAPEKKPVELEKPKEDDAQGDQDKDAETETESEDGDTEKEKGSDSEPTEEEILQKIADDEKCSLEEAKEILAKDKAIVERHSSDPVKIARALRKEQSAYGKLDAENKELKSYRDKMERERTKFHEEAFNRNIESRKLEIIEKYISLHPDEADLHEDVLFERAKVLIKDALKKEEEKAAKALAEKAETTKKELIEKISTEYADIVPEVKDALSDMDAQVVTDPEFDIMHMVFWARGKKYTPEYVKSLEDAAFKRGQEDPKIKQKKSLDSQPRSSSASKGAVASPADRARAIEMFSNRDGWSEEKMVEEYMKNHKGKDFFD